MRDTKDPNTILLAEDDELVREIAQQTLQDAGYRVVAVGDGAEALAALDQVQPDLILSDVRMPRCDGFELLQRVRCDARHETTPFIIMSAKADTANQRMGMSLGADDYVTKPYRSADLLKTIRVRLTRAETVRDILRRQEYFLTQVLPHELRTPLTGIIGYSELMISMGAEGQAWTAEDLRHYGQIFGMAGRRLLRVAEDLSLWSWLESIRREQALGRSPELTTARLTTDLVRRWGRDSAELYGRANDLLVDVEPAMVRVPTEGLERVIAHLIDNAFKFSRPGDPVNVEGRTVAGVLELRVRDVGRGMSEEEVRAVGVTRQFGRDRFEQQGLGMGVGLARGFAELAGGDLRLAANEGGRGMCTVLMLPAEEPKPGLP